MFGVIKQALIGLLATIHHASSYAKWISLNNQPSITQPTLINLHPNESKQGLRYYSFAVNLDRYAEIRLKI